MYRYIIRFVSLGFVAFLLISLDGCSSSFKQIELKPEFGFADKETITVYIVPSGRKILDETYARVFQLDLQSRGYKIINANKQLQINSDSIIGTNHRQIADALLVKTYLPSSDVIAIARPIWDSVYFATDLSEKITFSGMSTTYEGYYLPSLYSEVTFFDRSIREPIKSYAAIDTTRLYFDEDQEHRSYTESSWMVIAKQLTRNLGNIPICKIVHSSPATNQIGVSFWIDKSYREAFPKEWKNRLTLRVLFANDILRSQFDIELTISEFKEWDSRFETSLEKTLKSLQKEKTSNPKLFRIGFTLDKGLKATWNNRSKLGLAVLLGTDAVITSQPSFQEVAQFWNPLEEAITLVHEVGHMLGAIHIPEEISIMYPSSGSLSYEFDALNQSIIHATGNSFFNVDKRQRAQNYVKELIEYRKTSSKNSVPVLFAISNAVLNSYNLRETKRIYKPLLNIIDVSVHTLAVMGYIEFKINNRFKQARDLFTKVIELEPDFAEVHWYLSLVLRRMGDEIVADKHKEIAKPYRSLWILDD